VPASLNTDQRNAVEHQGGPLLVVAGPGSGKTRVIIERIIYLTGKGIKPAELLCLTFSEKAAEEMKQRLEKVIDVSEMDVSTFHSFAKEVLEDNVLDSGVGVSAGVITKSAALVWGLKNIDNFGLQHLEIGNNAVDLIQSIIEGISTFKDELVFPDELEKYLESKLKEELDDETKDFMQKLSDLCRVYKKYQEFQRGKAVIDFDDMVLLAIDLFKRKPNVLAKYHRKYKHILVDEFQDNNYAQLELVKLIAKAGEVTVVGDDDQLIYRFQGAYLTNFKDFQTYFPNTTVITLNQNYRSTKNILRVATGLLANVEEREKKNLETENEVSDRPEVVVCSSESAEVEFVVNKIRQMVGQSVKRRDGSEALLTYRDFVILSRRKMEGKKYAKALKAYGIPTVYIGEANIFSSPVVRDLMAYLQIASNLTTAGREITRLMKSHGITEQNIARINHAAKRKAREDPTDMDFVFEILKNCDIPEVTQKDEAKELAEQIEKIAALENSTTVSEFVYNVMMSMSDLYRRWIQDDEPQSRRNQLLLKEIYRIAIEYESLNPNGALDDFIKYLNLMGQFDLELTEGYEAEDAVQVTTIHQSKGKEFAVVFVVDVATNKLPLRFQGKEFYVPNDLSKGIKRNEDEKELYLQEERRLLYVAMTRAQNNLFITYAKRYGQNVRETKPSRFLEEIDFTANPNVRYITISSADSESGLAVEERIEKIKADLQEKAVRSINQMNLKSAIQRIIDLAMVKHFENQGTTEGFDHDDVLDVDNTDENLRSELLGKKVSLVQEDLHLSATSIKTYIDCPLRFKLSNILHVPEPARTYFDVGTAVHAVAEHLTNLEKEGTKPTEELALELLGKEWSSNAFQSETKERQKKGEAKEMLKTYLRWHSQNQNKPVAVEQKFQVEIAGVPFIGSIDRIEQTPNGELEIVDFKTGYAKESSRSLREDPQMNIYALGVEKVFEQLPKKASLFYVKHDKIVSYEIAYTQVAKVKEDIEQKVNAILAEKFDATPSFKACKNCSYWDLCEFKETEES
jgi:ATP-dependent DNA helicase UvrD/PcrA